MTEKRFTSMYNEQSDMIQYVDTLKEEPNKWSICNVSGTLKKLNELHEENQSSKEFIEQLQQELVLFKKAGADMGIDLNAQITALKKENGQLKQQLQREHTMLDNAILLERTRMGQNSLKQYKEAIQ